MWRTGIIDYLKERPITNWLFLIVYYLMVTLPHEWAGRLTVDIFGTMERSAYNQLISTTVVLLGGIVLFVLLGRLRRSAYRRFLMLYLLWCLALAVICNQLLFVIQIENVHYPQYAVFALLVFPLERGYLRTLLWVLLAGMIDEAYQYFYLAPERTLYYDWNDVITNVIGGGLGLWLIFLFGGSHHPRAIFRSAIFYAWFIASMGIILLFHWHYLGIYPESNAPFTLIKEHVDGFWTTVHPNVIYHVVQPAEAIVLVLLIILSFLPMQIKAAGIPVSD